MKIDLSNLSQFVKAFINLFRHNDDEHRIFYRTIIVMMIVALILTNTKSGEATSVISDVPLTQGGSPSVGHLVRGGKR